MTPVSYAEPPSNRCILIKARGDYETLVNMDLDIWKFEQDGALIRVTDDERNQIKESGFTIKTITEDVYEYFEKKRQEQIFLFAEPPSAKYHSYDEVITSLIGLEDSIIAKIAKTYIIGSTHEKRDIWAVKISDNPFKDEHEPAALIIGCLHAREWISVEVPLYIAQYLVDNYKSNQYVKDMIDNCEIWIVPVVNPDGYEYSRIYDRMWRKNRRDNEDGTFGVDLNRNFSKMWGGPNASPGTTSINYQGPQPFSEPETQAIRDLVRAHDFRVFVSYHNYGQEIYYPWRYTLEDAPMETYFYQMTLDMLDLIFEVNGKIYINGLDSPWFYLIGGSEIDWTYYKFGIYSFEIELPPSSPTFGGFILAEERIIPACEENLPAALYLIARCENIETKKPSAR